MDAMDGNAIAGTLYERFGADMTTAVGACAHCGASGQMAGLRVYVRGPGAVARCARCGGVVIVIVETSQSVRVELSAWRLLGSAAEPGTG
jgi:ribosomal protein S27AE